MIITQLFNIANLFVLPFWALMILLPNWGVTRKVMESYLPFVALALLYTEILHHSRVRYKTRRGLKSTAHSLSPLKWTEILAI